MEHYGYKYFHKLSQFVTTLNSQKIARKIWNQKMSRFLISFCTASHYENIESQVWEWRQSSHLQVWATFQEGLYATVYTGNFLKMLQLLPENLQHTQ